MALREEARERERETDGPNEPETAGRRRGPEKPVDFVDATGASVEAYPRLLSRRLRAEGKLGK